MPQVQLEITRGRQCEYALAGDGASSFEVFGTFCLRGDD